MKFTVNCVFAAFLFSIEWMSVVLADNGPLQNCCLTVSMTRIPVKNIVHYSMQAAPPCFVTAVRFRTKKEKIICSDPNDSWALRAINELNRRMNPVKPTIKGTSEEPTMCYTSMTKVFPTTATTDETSGTETKISMSTTVTPAVRTIKTSETETSASTTVSTTVTAVITSSLETKISKTTIQPTSVSKENPKSTAIRCGTGKTTATRVTITTKMKKLSKMMIRKKGKTSKNKNGMSGSEASTSTPVSPIVTTIETSAPEASTSAPLSPIVMTIEMSAPEANTSTPVPSIVTTIETSAPEASTSAPLSPVMTIEMSAPEASTSTPVPSIVTTIKPPGQDAEIGKTTTQPTSASKDNQESLSIVTTFQIGKRVTYRVVSDDMLGFLREFTSSTTKDCCLRVTKNKPAFHEIVDYRVQEAPHCSVRAVLFITVENNKICSSPVENWVPDYIKNLNRRRITTTEKTDRNELAITSIKPLEQDQSRFIETKEKFQLDMLSKVEKKQVDTLVSSVSFEIHDRYKNINNYFCLKKKPAKYFCIKQP